MTSMIERVQTAIEKAFHEHDDSPAGRNAVARAAVEAMAEPTAKMLAAVYPVLGIPDTPVWANCYRIMIDAALKEQP